MEGPKASIYRQPTPGNLWEGLTHLIVDVQDICLTLGSEVLRVRVHSEVRLLAHPLQENRVPVLVIQKATQYGRGRDAAESGFAVICRGREAGWSLSLGSFESCPSTALNTRYPMFPQTNVSCPSTVPITGNAGV